MPFHIGPMELVIVLTLVMIIFGVGRLPEVGGAVGKAIREFRTAQDTEAKKASAESAVEKTTGPRA